MSSYTIARCGLTYSSQLALERGTALPRIATLQLGPSVDRTRLNTQVPLPAIFRFEVAHSLDLVFPAVPDRNVGQLISHDDEAGLAILADGDLAIGRFGGVDTVGLTGADDVVGSFGEVVGAADFVDVACTGQTGDRGLGDVLICWSAY